IFTNRPVAIDIGVQQLEAATAVIAGLADKTLLITTLAHQAVDRSRRIIVVIAFVHIVVEMAGAQHGAIVVLGGDDFTENADTIVHRRITIEVTGAGIVIDRIEVMAVRTTGTKGIGVVG